MVMSPVHQVWPNHLAMHSERGKKTKEEVGRQHQGMDRPGVRQVPEGSGEQGKMEKTGCKIICGAPATLAVKGLMMMMMMTKDVLALCWFVMPCHVTGVAVTRTGESNVTTGWECGGVV